MDIQIIAEIGSNWIKYKEREKNIELALRQIDKAAECGADYVKFQSYQFEDLYGFKKPDNSTFKDIYISLIELEVLADYCVKTKIKFMCTAFRKYDYERINPFVELHKIASCESTDLDLIEAVLAFNKPVVISTGGLLAVEIDKIKGVCDTKRENVILADCVIKYPADGTDYSLIQIAEWRREGYGAALSDHTLSYHTALAAKGLGATVFEKHVDFYLSEGKTVDSCVSIGLKEFRQYINILKHGQSSKIIDKEQRTEALKYLRKKHVLGYYRPLPHAI